MSCLYWKRIEALEAVLTCDESMINELGIRLTPCYFNHRSYMARIKISPHFAHKSHIPRIKITSLQSEITHDQCKN